MLSENTQTYSVTRNACKLCTPLGASLAFKGIRGAVGFLHGSQGCSTYIRRYLISHFKEPIDIACSNFGEETAIFGGGANLKIGLENIRKQYDPELIGIATTCLSETIGDDVPMFIREYKELHPDEILPPMVHVSTPSYSGTHIEGFHAAIMATVDSLASASSPDPDSDKNVSEKGVNIFPGMLSPADLRHIKEILRDFGVPFVMLPDYSQTLDGPLWSEYQKIPSGGTNISDIRVMGSACASLEFGRVLAEKNSAGKLLQKRFNIPCHSLGMPIGINETDKFFAAIESATGKSTPKKYEEERGRLIDAYVDGHKYISGLLAAVYGDPDLVVGLASFLSEIGIIPVLCASGGKSGCLQAKLSEVVLPDYAEKEICVLDGGDFIGIETEAKRLEPDIFVGSSKGYSVSRKLNIPLIRAGFPIHDRIGGSRILHVGYSGAQQLFDRIVNTVIEKRQETSSIGYSYI
jgi:nitrogenase molybdenum-iron protein NifN